MAAPRAKIAPLTAYVILSIAVVGYFTGLQSPVSNQDDVYSGDTDNGSSESEGPAATDDGVLLATHYAEMPAATAQLSKYRQTSVSMLKSDFDPLAEFKITPQDKAAALRRRDANRAFNGAPPTIPHPIDQKSDRSCLACHQSGIITKSLRISRMSHQMLSNCTQCHVETESREMPATIFAENTFVGMPAPTGGPRAFAGAPPQIPHSTWMRNDCMSCHGYAGPYGIRTTHPWRQSCTQCHTPSSNLDQTLLAAEPLFLPPPVVEE